MRCIRGSLAAGASGATRAARSSAVNRWLPPFPPNAALNAQIGRASFLRGRIEHCARQRGRRGAITAVDVYQRTAVVAVTRQLNERR